MSLRITNRGLGAIAGLGVLGLLLLPTNSAFAADEPVKEPDVGYGTALWIADDDGGDPLWPQTIVSYTTTAGPDRDALDALATECGRTYQADVYRDDATTAALIAGGKLYGPSNPTESWPGDGYLPEYSKQWTTEPCVVEPPVDPPVDPPVYVTPTSCPELVTLPAATEDEPRGWGDTKGGTWTDAGLQLTAIATEEAYAYLDFTTGIPLSSSIGSLDTVYANLTGTFGVIIHTDKGNVHYDADGRYWLVTPGLLPETSPGFYSSYDLTDLEQDALIDEVAVWVNPGGSLLLQSQEYPCAIQPFGGEPEVVVPPTTTTAQLAYTGPDELRTLALAGGALVLLLTGAAGLLYRARARRMPLPAITGTE